MLDTGSSERDQPSRHHSRSLRHYLALTVDHQPLYRDFLIDRARYLLYRLVGTTIDDAATLAVAGGKSFWGLEANLVFRLLSTFDARRGL